VLSLASLFVLTHSSTAGSLTAPPMIDA
jgi:hypothetical protein